MNQKLQKRRKNSGRISLMGVNELWILNSMFFFLSVSFISNKDLLYNTGNTIQYLNGMFYTTKGSIYRWLGAVLLLCPLPYEAEFRIRFSFSEEEIIFYVLVKLS